jgi:hypothetical protein
MRTVHINTWYKPEDGEELVRLHDHRIRAYSLQSRKLGVAPETTLEAHICLRQPIIRRGMVPEEVIGDVSNHRQYTDRGPDAAEMKWSASCRNDLRKADGLEVVPGAAFTLALDRVQIVHLQNRESIIDVPCASANDLDSTAAVDVVTAGVGDIDLRAVALLGCKRHRKLRSRRRGWR